MAAIRSHAELRLTKPKKGGARIAHLRVWSGYWCAACERKGDQFATTHLPRMRDHMARQRDPDARPPNTPLVLWEECQLQISFAARSRVNYFVVAGASTDDGGALGQGQRGTRATLRTEADEKKKMAGTAKRWTVALRPPRCRQQPRGYLKGSSLMLSMYSGQPRAEVMALWRTLTRR